jgi:phosphatidylserine/phosphatidylglycerophosphate/cardiolipin synthase-like enzyme
LSPDYPEDDHSEYGYSEYFVTGEDCRRPGEVMPPIFAGCALTPLLDGAEYASALRAALDRVGRGKAAWQNSGQCIMISGWWLGLGRGGVELVSRGGRLAEAKLVDAPPFCLDPWPEPAVPFEDLPDETTALLNVLAEKVRAGVDVRVLGWISPVAAQLSGNSYLFSPFLGISYLRMINTLTLRSIAALRAIGVRALPNMAGHIAGSSHSKTVLVCDNENTVAFTGGIDLQFTRWARPDHSGRQIWHDVVARIEGRAVQTVYDHFRVMWQQNLAVRPTTLRMGGEHILSVPPGTPPIPVRTLPVLPGRGRYVVQGLQTLPVMRRLVRRPRSGRPASGSPVTGFPHGSFTYRDALLKAIGSARRYIYLEDALLWSKEIMVLINKALCRQPGLQVIMITGEIEDPNDPPLPHSRYQCQSLNHGLLAGLAVGQQKRIRILRRSGAFVHAKTMIVDDVWAVIGSGNLARRSLYTDIEHGVSFADPGGDGVRRYRMRLWSHHLAGVDPARLLDLDGALDLLQSDQFVQCAALEPLTLPVPEVEFSWRQRLIYNALHDYDSRRRWAGASRATYDS